MAAQSGTCLTRNCAYFGSGREVWRGGLLLLLEHRMPLDSSRVAHNIPRSHIEGSLTSRTPHLVSESD